MKISCGVDIVQIVRIKKLIEKYGAVNIENPFIKRLFHPEELLHILNRAEPYSGIAGRFAAKEAVIKALNSIKKVTDLKSIQIVGQIPVVKLNDNELAGINISVSISHDGDYAIAVANILCEDK